MQQSKTKALAFSAVFTALIFISITMFRVPNGLGGFIHFGDSLIFIGAAWLPFPFGLFVAAIGPGLFNLFSESPFWFPFTIVIKPIMAWCFSSTGSKILGSKRNIAAPFIAAGINTVLYFGANMILFAMGILPSGHVGAWAAGVAALPALLVQGAGSVVIFFILAVALDKLKVKERFK
ncbi:MAG: ECF transporter S component [Defluviitaleaceae bacterium]|nr:ECF transporter S component [Defluviitaleaceae bacterium]